MAQNSILSDFFKKHGNPYILKSKKYAYPSSLINANQIHTVARNCKIY